MLAIVIMLSCRVILINDLLHDNLMLSYKLEMCGTGYARISLLMYLNLCAMNLTYEDMGKEAHWS